MVERNALGESAAMLAAKGDHLACLKYIVERACDDYEVSTVCMHKYVYKSVCMYVQYVKIYSCVYVCMYVCMYA